MLKKAGIVVAVAAAGMLALSPLAFAGSKDDNGQGQGQGQGQGHSSHSSVEKNTNAAGNSSQGLVNVADNNVNVPVQACGNNVPVNVLGVQVSDVTAELTGALGLLGRTGASSSQSVDRSCGDNSGSAGNTTLQNIGG